MSKWKKLEEHDGLFVAQYIREPTPTYLPTTKYGYLGEKRQLERLLWKSPPSQEGEMKKKNFDGIEPGDEP